VVGSTQPEAQARMSAEIARWGDVIRKGNIKPQ